MNTRNRNVMGILIIGHIQGLGNTLEAHDSGNTGLLIILYVLCKTFFNKIIMINKLIIIKIKSIQKLNHLLEFANMIQLL